MNQIILPDLYESALAERDRRSKERAESSLYEFVKQSWHVVEPGVEFTHGWHLEVICEHLEAITAGELQRLLINIPPRHAKSTIVSVMFPVWEWLARPAEKYLCASYSSVLSTRDSLKARRLLTSPWYQSRWGHLFRLTGDQNAKQRYENDQTGYRIATSVGGTATGEGGSRLILDDPHGAQDAQSDAMRESALEWFDMVWSTRLNTPKADAMITIMQRLHEKDISGHIIDDLKGWEHICLPAEWDGKRRTTMLGAYDPRESVGSLLWPERFDHDILNRLKTQLGEYGASGQLQQEPSPSGGGILKVDHFQKWPHDKQIPTFEFVIQSYDTAFTKNTQNDPTGCEVWGLFKHKNKMCAMLVDCWTEHLSYPELRERAVRDWHSTYGGDEKDPRRSKPRKPDIALIEEKASGQSLIQDLHIARVPVVPYNPGMADKISRAHQASPILELDCLYIPESKKTPGHFVSWAQPMVKQLERFPNADHDEYVDTFTQCMIYLRDKGWFDLEQAMEDEIEERDYYTEKKARVNPYAV